MVKSKSDSFHSAQSLFAGYQPEDKGGFITQEFQDFGYRMAVQLNDMQHKSLYMRLAKQEDRLLLEQALSYVSDANAQSKARLFMWKLKELRAAKKTAAANKKTHAS